MDTITGVGEALQFQLSDGGSKELKGKISSMKSKLFIKYFLSYLVVFLFMFFLIVLYIYHTTIKGIYSEVEDSNIAQLNQVDITITENFREIKNIGNLIGSDSAFIPSRVSNSRFTNDTQNELRKYKANNSWIEDIYLNYGDDTIFSTRGTMTVDAMLDNNVYFENLDKKRFFEEINSKKEAIKFIYYDYPNAVERIKIAYLIPLKHGAGESFGQSVLLLDATEITRHFRSITNPITFILNENEEIVSLTSKEFNKEQLTSSLQADENSLSNNEITINGEKYILSLFKSDYLGWTYGSMISQNEFFAPIRRTYFVYFISFAFILTMGILVSFAFAYYQYNPINNLFQKLDRRLPDLKTELNGLNKLESLNIAVTDLVNQNRELRSEIDFQKPLIRNQIITQLLEGSITKEKAIEVMKVNRLSFYSKLYFVVTMETKRLPMTEWNADVHEAILEKYSDYVWDDCIINAVVLDYKEEVLLIVGSNDERETFTDENRLIKICEHLLSGMQKFVKTDLVLGVGTVNDDLSKIKQSYIESVVALEHQFYYRDKNFIFFEDLDSTTKGNFIFPSDKLILRFERSLTEGDEEVAKESLENIYGFLTTNQLTFAEIKYGSFELVRTIVTFMSDNNMLSHKEEVDRLINTGDFEEMFRILNQFVEQICSKQNEMIEYDKYRISEDIITYVEENYLSQTLSLEEISSVFNISISYVSRLIKEHKSVSFSHYIQELRMEEFKNRLVQTNKPIKDIVQEIGYVDASNFSRKFKKAYGLTPSQFREKSR